MLDNQETEAETKIHWVKDLDLFWIVERVVLLLALIVVLVDVLFWRV